MAKKKNKKNKSASSAPAMTYEERRTAEAAKAKRKKRGIIVAAIAGIAAVIVFVLIGSASTGIYAAHTHAATVGGVRVSTPLYDYYYENTYYAIANGYGDSPENTIGEDWKDLVISYTDYTLQQDIALYTEAVNAGVTLSEEGQAAVDAAVEEMRSTAVQNGQEDVDEYLAGSVGAGCNIENYRQYMEIQTLADEYSAAHRASLTITQEEVDARYDEDPSRYDMYTFYSSYLKGATEADARAVAAQITDLDSYDSVIIAYRTENPDSVADGADPEAIPSETSLRNNLRSDYVNTDILAWIEAAPRHEGDVTYVNYNDSGYFIVYYVSKNEDRAVIDSEITEDLRNDAMSDWLAGLLEQYPVEHSWIGMQGVGAYDR